VVSEQHRVEIARPPEDVFAFLADGTNNPRWQKRVTKSTQSGDSLGVGTTFAQSIRHPLGFRVPFGYRITTFDRPRTLAVVGVSGDPIRPTVTYEIVASPPEGSSVTCTLEYALAGGARIAAPILVLLRPLFAWEASWLDNARDVLESTDTTD
jgi:hypothetical protein